MILGYKVKEKSKMENGKNSSGVMTKDLKSRLTDFLMSEIGSKALDGITYAMVMKDDKEKDRLERYMNIKRIAVENGFTNDEVFRVYEVSNGYVFDMDLNIAKMITEKLSEAVALANGGNTPVGNLIGEAPEKRRKDDMLGLAKYIKKQYDDGKREVVVALFSRNNSPRIIITGVGPKNEMVTIRYNSYAIRPYDLQSVNANMLIPAGFRISSVEAYQVLPSKTGVKFKLYLERI